jgi:putative (di)nucleoside polyphosphate hydrolase
MRECNPDFHFADTDEADQYALPYRRGVGMMVFNEEGKIFIGKRITSKNDTWQMPQGGIKEDETVIEAGLRELYEETNMMDIKIICESRRWLYYDLPQFLVGRLWDGQYRGQKQKWLLASFHGMESVINVKKSHAEFDAWKWLDIEKIPDVVVPFKKHIYVSVVEEFRDTIKEIVGKNYKAP